MRLVDEAEQNHRVRQPFQGLVVNERRQGILPMQPDEGEEMRGMRPGT
jgi:hypothetical protein